MARKKSRHSSPVSVALLKGLAVIVILLVSFIGIKTFRDHNKYLSNRERHLQEYQEKFNRALLYNIDQQLNNPLISFGPVQANTYSNYDIANTCQYAGKYEPGKTITCYKGDSARINITEVTKPQIRQAAQILNDRLNIYGWRLGTLLNPVELATWGETVANGTVTLGYGGTYNKKIDAETSCEFSYDAINDDPGNRQTSGPPTKILLTMICNLDEHVKS